MYKTVKESTLRYMYGFKPSGSMKFYKIILSMIDKIAPGAIKHPAKPGDRVKVDLGGPIITPVDWQELIKKSGFELEKPGYELETWKEKIEDEKIWIQIKKYTNLRWEVLKFDPKGVWVKLGEGNSLEELEKLL